ncbi:nucleotidyltransferase family protein, partial [Gemella sanguinis]
AKNIIENNGGGEIVCVMSEFFTQRGEVAIVDGYIRAEEAVRAGCDMVIALPYLASVAYSDDFAKKSIEILSNSGITHLIFGTEDTSIETFEEIYNKQQNITEEQYRELLKQGYNFATINSKILGLQNDIPNFILAYSYYKNIRKYAPHIKLLPVKREGQGLNKEEVEDKQFLSATAIRKNIDNSVVTNYLSKEMIESIRESKILSEEDFFDLIKYKIMSLGKAGLKNIYDVNEGLENRIYDMANIATDYQELVNSISTKRYSKKKIQRILLHILTNTTKADYNEFFGTKVFRVLAAKEDKASIIREINNQSNITLVPVLNSKTSSYFVHDIKVARIYNLKAQQEDIFRKNIILIK